MTNSNISKVSSFSNEISCVSPIKFPCPFQSKPHEIAKLAAQDLQTSLLPSLNHNFGIDPVEDNRPIGKMFGVLVVNDVKGKIGYLSAFSGKLNGGNHYDGFVPPVYDGLQEGGFLNKGMTELSVIVRKVRALQELKDPRKESELKALIEQRSEHSQALQRKLFESYYFLNNDKKSKSLLEIFSGKQPQGGSGECAAPKLLQYAFMNDLKPIAIAEFWWGLSNSQQRVHKEYYPACEEKCRPILGWMLS